MGSQNVPAGGKRVCIAYPFFAHYRGPVLRELLANGRHTYTLMADRKAPEPSIKLWEAPPGTDWVDAPVWRLGGRQPIYIQWGLLRAALSSKYDTIIILAAVWWPTTWVAAVLGRLTGKRMLTWGHGWTRREGGVRGLLRRVYYRLYHAHTTYGHYAKMLMMEHGWAPERVHVVYNSLDYPVQKAQRLTVTRDELTAMKRQVMGDGPERPIAICTTRLVAFRKLHQLIEAAALLNQRGHPLDVLLVGDGPEKEKLAARAKELGVRCVFYGACYEEAKLCRLIMMSNVMVSPGAIGLAVMHAHAYGTAVVTHDDIETHGPEFEAMVPGRNGSIFKQDDIEGLANAIAEWTKTPSPDESVREKCYSIVERFWNAEFQREAIERAVDGKEADDIWWMKEPNNLPASRIR
jgi:glycosyltransferase involved in cell wall biosynthesis